MANIKIMGIYAIGGIATFNLHRIALCVRGIMPHEKESPTAPRRHSEPQKEGAGLRVSMKG